MCPHCATYVRYLQLSNRGIHFACFPELAIKLGVAFCTRCCDLQSLHLRKEESFLHEVLKVVRVVDLGRIASNARLNTEPTVTSVREGGREGGMDGWCGDMKHFFIVIQLLS